MDNKPHRPRPSRINASILLYALAGSCALVLASFSQKLMLGIPPFKPLGYLIPVIFGGLTGASIGLLIGRVKTEHAQHLSAQEKSTAQLRTSEDMFRMLAENAHDILFRWNLEQRCFEYISPAVLEISGYSPDDFLRNPQLFRGIICKDDIQIIDHLFDNSGNPKPFIEYRITHKQGHTVWINQRNSIFRNATGNPIYYEGIATDISDFVRARAQKKLLYKQLNQSQKLESIGRLAGGIAHDFNNLLTVINGYSDLVLEDLDSQDQNYAEIKHIHTAGLKAAALTAQLLAFSKDQMEDPRILNLTPIMQEFMTMLRRIIGANITVKLEIDDNLPLVLLDAVHFDQIILNLVINARDAMQNGGLLEINLTEAIMVDQTCDQCGETMQGTFVQLSVSDTGRGITPDVLERIFDPFFTTKKDGQGTGLGLATVIGLVLQYHGHIQIETTQGIGTCFNIFFPASKITSTKSGEVLEFPGNRNLYGNERILLVEDEGLIRTLTQTLLEQYGYQVTVAADGETGLKIFKESDFAIDMLLTDIMMPGMDGRELYQQAVLLSPELKILFMSGYTDSITLNGAPVDKELHFLAKPFGANDLALKVRKALDSPPGL